MLEIGDVTDETRECRRPRQIDPRDRQLDRELAPISAHRRQFDSPVEVCGLPGLEVAHQAFTMPRPKRRRHYQLCHVVTRDLIARVAEDALGGGIELNDAALLVHRDDGVERGAEDRSGQRLAPMGGVLRAAADDELADEVSEYGHRSEQRPVRLLWLAREELHRADDSARALDRKAESSSEARTYSRVSAREVGVFDDVHDPSRLAGRPDATRQPLAAFEGNSLGQ